MKRLVIILCLVITSINLRAGPVVVGNGGGVSELYLALALEKFESTVELCLKTELCAQGERVKAALELLLKNAGDERRLSKLVFVDTDKPQSHLKWGEVYKTEAHLGAAIYIDAVYINSNIKSLARAMQFIVAPIATHAQLFNSELVAVIERRLGQISELEAPSSNWPSDEKSCYSAVLLSYPHSSNGSAPESVPFQLLILDSQKAYELQEDVSRAIRCLGGGIVVGAQLSNLRWAANSSVESLILLADTSFVCTDGKALHSYRGLIRVRAMGSVLDSCGEIDRKSVLIELTKVTKDH